MPDRANPKRATSADVARHSGVSRTTVSMVINGNDTSISEQTRQRVRASIHALHYVPNASAKSLRGINNDLVLLPAVVYRDSETAARFVALLRSHLKERGLRLIYDADRYDNSVEAARRWADQRPNLVISTPNSVTKEAAEILKSEGVKNILLLTDSPVPYASSVLLSSGLGAVAARHLITDLGHQDIVVFGALDRAHSVFPAESEHSAYRIREFTKVAEASDVRVRQASVSLTRTDIIETVRQWQVEKSVPTAIYAVNDVYALALINVLQEHGVRVPEDVSVVGTDNSALAKIIRPLLTSVHADTDNFARDIADYSRKLIDRPGKSRRATFHTDASIKIAVRESTAPPRDISHAPAPAGADRARSQKR